MSWFFRSHKIRFKDDDLHNCKSKIGLLFPIYLSRMLMSPNESKHSFILSLNIAVEDF